MTSVLITHATHLAVGFSLALLSPEKVIRMARLVGALFPMSIHTARHAAGSLEPWGTCLTRSIAVASRIPDAQVVLAGALDGRFRAHAWVEIAGTPLRSWDRFGAVLARF